MTKKMGTTTTKLVWLFATIILFNSVQVLCGDEREKAVLDMCKTADKNCTILMNEGGNPKIAFNLAKATKEGNACVDKEAIFVAEVKSCLRNVTTDKECIHSNECPKDDICIPAPTPLPNSSGRRTCQNLSVFLKPNYYFVTILLIILSALAA